MERTGRCPLRREGDLAAAADRELNAVITMLDEVIGSRRGRALIEDMDGTPPGLDSLARDPVAVFCSQR